MIANVGEVSYILEPAGLDQDQIRMMMDAVEAMIRKYTNNNFQNRNVRFSASSSGKVLDGSHPFLKEGDTIQITESKVNDGLYVVTEVGDTITVDKDLFPVEHNLVTKVEYPADVVAGALNLLKWEVKMRSKVGVKSETLSRHSTTYYDQDASNQVMGYPVSLLGFLAGYMKARF